MSFYTRMEKPHVKLGFVLILQLSSASFTHSKYQKNIIFLQNIIIPLDIPETEKLPNKVKTSYSYSSHIRGTNNYITVLTTGKIFALDFTPAFAV